MEKILITPFCGYFFKFKPNYILWVTKKRFNFKQQIYGPLVLGFKSNYNINTDSSKYGKFENKIISFELSRREYSLGISYLEDDKSFFFGFEIFNFGDHKFDKKF